MAGFFLMSKIANKIKVYLGHQVSVISHRSLVGGKIKNFCHPVGALRNPSYAHKMRRNNRDSMTWVPWSSHGMTEFFLQKFCFYLHC